MLFDDEFIEPRLDEIMQVEIGQFFISPESATRLREILELDGNNEDELVAKRNSLVKLLSERRKQIHTLNDVFDGMKFITASTSVIDQALISIGAEV